MCINAIEGVSSARPVNKADELYAASLAQQPSPIRDFGSPLVAAMGGTSLRRTWLRMHKGSTAAGS
jgi:hypothetical protein